MGKSMTPDAINAVRAARRDMASNHAVKLGGIANAYWQAAWGCRAAERRAANRPWTDTAEHEHEHARLADDGCPHA